MLPSGSRAAMLLKEVTLGKTRVVVHDSGLRMSPFYHPKAALRAQRKVVNVFGRGSSRSLAPIVTHRARRQTHTNTSNP